MKIMHEVSISREVLLRAYRKNLQLSKHEKKVLRLIFGV